MNFVFFFFSFFVCVCSVFTVTYLDKLSDSVCTLVTAVQSWQFSSSWALLNLKELPRCELSCSLF